MINKQDLKKYGITGVEEIIYNPSYDELFREETKTHTLVVICCYIE